MESKPEFHIFTSGILNRYENPDEHTKRNHIEAFHIMLDSFFNYITAESDHPFLRHFNVKVVHFDPTEKPVNRNRVNSMIRKLTIPSEKFVQEFVRAPLPLDHIESIHPHIVLDFAHILLNIGVGEVTIKTTAHGINHNAFIGYNQRRYKINSIYPDYLPSMNIQFLTCFKLFSK